MQNTNYIEYGAAQDKINLFLRTKMKERLGLDDLIGLIANKTFDQEYDTQIALCKDEWDEYLRSVSHL